MNNNDNTNPESAVMTVELAISRQPMQYNSVRVGATVPIFVRPGDDVWTLLNEGLDTLAASLGGKVDDEFETYGQPAPYYRGQRFMLISTNGERLAAILPTMDRAKLPGGWKDTILNHDGHRLTYIQDRASELEDVSIIDCADGDLSKLPPLQKFWRYNHRDLKLIVLTADHNRIPDEILGQYPGHWGQQSFTRLPETLKPELEQQAQANGHTFIDCTDGDWSKLPLALVPPDLVPADLVTNPDLEDDPEDDDDEAFDSIYGDEDDD